MLDVKEVENEINGDCGECETTHSEGITLGSVLEGAVESDSFDDTMLHIEQVEELLNDVVEELDHRAANHDLSKLGPDEKPLFDEFTPLLQKVEYGSEEYKKHLAKMKPAVQHHYKANRHHPEHHMNGVRGMSLVDLIEMLADWKAATLRHDTGDMMKSLEINRKRFEYGPELHQILLNTVKDMDWK